jgi:hypothetical protein
MKCRFSRGRNAKASDNITFRRVRQLAGLCFHVNVHIVLLRFITFTIARQYFIPSLSCHPVHPSIVIMGRNGFMGNISGIDAFGKVGLHTGCGMRPPSDPSDSLPCH